MKELKIQWTEDLDDPNGDTYIISVDGVDFKTWEKKHPLMNIDRKTWSTKFNHGAVKYEIAMSLYKNKCVWISGPHKGAKHDMTIFRESLKYKMAAGKLVIADRGYQSKKSHERMTSTPNRVESKEVHNFESRARL